MDIQPITQQTAALTNKDKEDASLKKACHDFESLMVAQMLKKMQESIQKTDLFGSSEKEEMFQDMLNDEVANELSSQNGIGLGDLIYKQLTAK